MMRYHLCLVESLLGSNFIVCNLAPIVSSIAHGWEEDLILCSNVNIVDSHRCLELKAVQAQRVQMHRRE